MPGSKEHTVGEGDDGSEDFELHEANGDESEISPSQRLDRRHEVRRAEDHHSRPHQTIVNNATPVDPTMPQAESLWEKRAKSIVAVVLVFGAFSVMFNDQRAAVKEQTAAMKEQAADARTQMMAQQAQIQAVNAAQAAATAAALRKSEDAVEAAWKKRNEERQEGLKHANEFVVGQQKMNEKLDVLIELTRTKVKAKPPTMVPPKDDSRRAPMPREVG